MQISFTILWENRFQIKFSYVTYEKNYAQIVIWTSQFCVKLSHSSWIKLQLITTSFWHKIRQQMTSKQLNDCAKRHYATVVRKSGKRLLQNWFDPLIIKRSHNCIIFKLQGYLRKLSNIMKRFTDCVITLKKWPCSYITEFQIIALFSNCKDTYENCRMK